MASLLIIVVIILLFKLVTEFLPKDRFSTYGEIISNDEIAELIKENKRAGIITYQSPTLIDSANQIYLIPVSQIKLKNAEIIPESDNTVMAMEVLSSEFSYRHSYRGDQLNNIVIVDLKNSSSDILFEERTCIVEHESISIESNKYILMLACTNDSNNDRLLNGEDLLDVILYDVKNKEMIKLNDRVEHFIHFSLFHKSDDIFLKVGIDRDGDNEFDELNEPIEIRRVDVKNRKIIRLVNPEIENQLQSILDGK